MAEVRTGGTVGVVGESSRELRQLVRASGDQVGLSVETRAFAEEPAARAALHSGDVSVLLVDQQRLEWKAETDEQLQAVVTSAVQVFERERRSPSSASLLRRHERLLRGT